MSWAAARFRNAGVWCAVLSCGCLMPNEDFDEELDSGDTSGPDGSEGPGESDGPGGSGGPAPDCMEDTGSDGVVDLGSLATLEQAVGHGALAGPDDSAQFIARVPPSTADGGTRPVDAGPFPVASVASEGGPLEVCMSVACPGMPSSVNAGGCSIVGGSVPMEQAVVCCGQGQVEVFYACEWTGPPPPEVPVEVTVSGAPTCTSFAVRVAVIPP